MRQLSGRQMKGTVMMDASHNSEPPLSTRLRDLSHIEREENIPLLQTQEIPIDSSFPSASPKVFFFFFFSFKQTMTRIL